MIKNILEYYVSKLENYLKSQFLQPEGIVKLSNITNEDKEDIMNKLIVSLLSIERETNQGIAPVNSRDVSGSYNYGFPPINVNINIVFAAVFNNNRYIDSLSVLSSTILFLQSNPVFIIEDNQKYTIEIMTLSTHELNNIWTCMGGQYYPSIVCKIRKVIFDSAEIMRTSSRIEYVNTEIEKK